MSGNRRGGDIIAPVCAKEGLPVCVEVDALEFVRDIECADC